MFQVLDADYWAALAALPDGPQRLEAEFGSIMADRDRARDIAAAAARGHVAQLAAAQVLKKRNDQLLAANSALVEARREARCFVETLARALGRTEGDDPGALLALARAYDYLGWIGPDGPAVPGIQKEQA